MPEPRPDDLSIEAARERKRLERERVRADKLASMAATIAAGYVSHPASGVASLEQLAETSVELAELILQRLGHLQPTDD